LEGLCGRQSELALLRCDTGAFSQGWAELLAVLLRPSDNPLQLRLWRRHPALPVRHTCIQLVASKNPNNSCTIADIQVPDSVAGSLSNL